MRRKEQEEGLITSKTDYKGEKQTRRTYGIMG